MVPVGMSVLVPRWMVNTCRAESRPCVKLLSCPTQHTALLCTQHKLWLQLGKPMSKANQMPLRQPLNLDVLRVLPVQLPSESL